MPVGFFDRKSYTCAGLFCWFTSHSEFIVCRHEASVWQCVPSQGHEYARMTNIEVRCPPSEFDAPCEVLDYCTLTYEERPILPFVTYVSLMFAFNIVLFGSISGLAVLMVLDRWVDRRSKHSY